MNAFRNWYVMHQDAITWFVIGAATIAFVNSVAAQDWFWAVVSAVLIVINYRFRKFRMQ